MMSKLGSVYITLGEPEGELSGCTCEIGDWAGYEIERLRAEIANAQTEDYERRWYLTQAENERLTAELDAANAEIECLQRHCDNFLNEITRLTAERDAWRSAAEDQYGKLRIALYGDAGSDYPVEGALDAWARGRYPALAAAPKPEDAA